MTDERSRRFEEDLAAVLRQVAGDGAPASLRDSLADVTATPPVERRSWFAPPLRWAAVAVGAVAVAVLAFLMVPHENVGPMPTSSAQPTATEPSASGSPSPTGEASPTASPSVAPSPTAAPTPAPAAWSSLTWSQGAAMGNGQYLGDLMPWGDGYVGVGGIDDGSGMDPAFFTSGDGTHWTLVKRLSATRTDEVAGVLAAEVVRIGDRLLAVGGAVMNGPVGRPDFPAPLWVSDDGTTWTPLHSATWEAASPWPAWVLSGPAGVVAVSGGTDPVVISSSDGSTWTRATLPAAVQAIAKDVAASSGGFVIVGRDGEPDQFCCAVENTPPPAGVGRPAAWISVDGLHWSEASVEGNTVSGAELQHVVAVDSGLLAVGVNSAVELSEVVPTSWTSSDGRSWSIATHVQWPLRATGYPTFAADGEHALVLGRAPTGSTLAAWVTTDGVTWTRLTFGSAGNAPVIDCGSQSDCVRVDRAWLVPGVVIVQGTRASGEGAQQIWVATPGS